MKVLLTEKYIRGLAPKNKNYIVWDVDTPGFGLKVTPTGARVFVLQRRIRGKERKRVLGHSPVMTVKQARAACLDTQEALAIKTLESRNRLLPCLDEFINGIWMEQKFIQLKPSGQRSTLSYIRSRIIPAFGKRYLDEMTKPVIAGWFDTYSKTYPGGANRSLEILISILEFAIVCGHIEENPAKGIKKNPKKIHNRFLSGEEIKRLSKVLAKAETENLDYRQGADIARLLLLTGCRHREISHLKWSMIKDDIIKLPDTKTGPREVYLTVEAVALLEKQPRNGSGFVFPWRKDPTKPRDNIDMFWADIRKRAGIEDVRVHDLRHTFASHAVIKGVTIPMVSKLLGHRKTAMTLRYTHVSDKDTEAAAERIGTILRCLLDGKSPVPEPKPKKIKKRRLKPPKVPTVSTIFSVRVNEEELASVSAKAKAEDLGVGIWARQRLNTPPDSVPQPKIGPASRTKTISFRVPRTQAEQYKQAAETAGYPVSYWARAVLSG